MCLMCWNINLYKFNYIYNYIIFNLWIGIKFIYPLIHNTTSMCIIGYNWVIEWKWHLLLSAINRDIKRTCENFIDHISRNTCRTSHKKVILQEYKNLNGWYTMLISTNYRFFVANSIDGTLPSLSSLSSSSLSSTTSHPLERGTNPHVSVNTTAVSNRRETDEEEDSTRRWRPW